MFLHVFFFFFVLFFFSSVFCVFRALGFLVFFGFRF